MSRKTVCRELHRSGGHSFTLCRTPLPTAKHVKNRLTFAKEHLDKGIEFWELDVWSDESKNSTFGRNEACHVWRKTETTYDPKNTIASVKHGGGSIMVWGCFTIHGTWKLHIINRKTYSSMYRQILEQKLL